MQQPNFEKVPLICLRLLRRIGDVDGIKELVTKSFYQIWLAQISNPVCCCAAIARVGMLWRYINEQLRMQ